MADRSVDRLLARGFESSRDGIWLFDVEGRILHANRRAGELMGRSVEELTGMTVMDLLDDSGRAQFREHLRELPVRGVNMADVECRYRTPTGDLVRVMVGESELRDDAGELVGYVHRMIGDSRRLEMLDEITRGRAQLADAQSIARLGSWEIDYRTDAVTWSPQIYEVLRLDPATTRPDIATFFAMLHEEDRPAVEEEYAAARSGPGQHSIDARIVLGDGSVRWVRVLGQALEWSPDGSPIRVGGTVQDIDEAKQTELQLRDAVVLNTLMQFMATAANEANTLREAMRTLRDLLLDHPDWCAAVAFEVRGSEKLVPVHIADDDGHTDLEHATALRALRAHDVVFEEDAAPQNPMIAFPVTLGDRSLIVAVVTACSPFERQPMLRTMARQISAQLATVAAREVVAAELSTARDHAMEASRAKSEFVATMSHEIRTPLNGVIGLNDLLLRTSLDPHQRRLAEGMQGAGRALLRLINDILDFSKIEAGALDLERVPFSPRDVVTDLLALFRPEATDRGNRLEADFSDAVPQALVGDPGRFRQVLANLVSNAVKFTADGEVTVHVGATSIGPVIELRVEVSDTGIGMTEQQLDRVFDPFRQADASTTRDYGGTGLGLTIARQLAAALDGAVGARSSPGSGSTFWFTSRFEAQAALQPVAPTDAFVPTPGAGHVLVVEDNETNQLVALGMLQALGYTADVAVDGAEGARRALAGEYDAVLMDLQMPGTDGFQGTALIRAGLREGVHLPVIALTASTTDDVRERCAAAGMEGFLTKPLSMERLDEELRRCLHPESRARASEPPRSSAAGRSDPRPARPAAHGRTLEGGRLLELAEMGEEAAPLIRRAVENFVHRAGGEVAELRAATGRGDHEAVRMTAHRLKGSAANLGLVEVAELAFGLEQLGAAATSGVTDAEARERAVDLLDRLATALQDGIVALRHHPVVAWCRARSPHGASPDSVA